MKDRNLIIVIDSDTLRLVRAWLSESLAARKQPAGATPPPMPTAAVERFAEALAGVRDGGTLEGTPYAIEETSAPLTTGGAKAAKAEGKGHE